MPGDGSYYVSRISAVLFGSLTPHQIRWHLALCEGNAYEAQYWIQRGVEIEHCGIAKHGEPDRLHT